MDTYFPIIVIIILVFVQTYLVLNRYLVYALLLSIAFSISIITYLKIYDLVIVCILGNTLFYLMVFAAYITRPRFKTTEE